MRSVAAEPFPDLVNRDFRADGPDRLWVADITQLPTRSGSCYLASIVDAFSRRVVGWSMATHMRERYRSSPAAKAVKRTTVHETGATLLQGPATPPIDGALPLSPFLHPNGLDATC